MVEGDFEQLRRVIGLLVVHAHPFLARGLAGRSLRYCLEKIVLRADYRSLRNGCSNGCCPAVCARAWATSQA
jgi:hypothetical protein